MAGPLHQIRKAGADRGLDTGGIYATARTSISAQDTTGTLHDRLASLGAALMAAKIDRAETKSDWAKPADVLDRAIRAFSPFPGAWCLLPDGARAKILLCQAEAGEGAAGTALDDRLLIACGQGALRLLKIQREGKGALD
eukprot:gene49127-65850_t